MICEACRSFTDPKNGDCSRCAEKLVAPSYHSSGDGLRRSDSYDAYIAAAESRLAALTMHLAAVEEETAAITESLASARRALADPVASDGSARPVAPRHSAIDAGPLRLTFPDPYGARVEPVQPRPVVAAVRRITPEIIAIPPIHLRSDATHAIWAALAGGARTVRVAGERGAGVTTLLAVLARQAGDHGFADGALYLFDVRGPADDVGQRVAAFLDTPIAPRYYLPAELRALGSNLHALILLDRAEINAEDEAALGALFPRLRFVIADSLAVPETPTIMLGPLVADVALLVVEAGYGRRIDDEERDSALGLAATSGGLPGRVRLVGVAARKLGRSFVSLKAEFAGGNEVVAALIADLSPTERFILAVVAMAPALMTAERLENLAGREIRESLERLHDCELVRVSGECYEVPGAVEPLIPLPPDPKTVFARITEMLRSDLERRPAASFTDRELAAAEALIYTAQRFDWLSVLTLGPVFARRFALQGAFGAWGRVLTIVIAAAKRADDPVTLNAARHDLGARYLLLGDHHKALTSLRTASQQRESIGDHAGASISATLLAHVRDIVPAADPLGTRRPAERTPPLPAGQNTASDPAAAPEPTGFPGRKAQRSPRPPARTGLGGRRAALLAAQTAAGQRPMRLVALAIAGVAVLALVLWIRTPTHRALATHSGGRQSQRAVIGAVSGASPRPLKINAFGATPARIEAGRSTRLCYDVSGAGLLKIVPKVGNLEVQRACRTVTLPEPHRYTYDLIAWGDNGQIAVRRARIDVVARATPALSPAHASSPQPQPEATVAAVQPATPAPAPARATAPPAPPPDDRLAKRAVYQFDATPAIVERGQVSSLCVGVGRWAQGDVTAIGTLEPGVTRCYRVKPSKTTVYRLHVALDKSVAYETVTVAVRSPSHSH